MTSKSLTTYGLYNLFKTLISLTMRSKSSGRLIFSLSKILMATDSPVVI